MTERSETADMIEPKLANEPTENADANDPMLPIESIEPTEPMDRIDPREPMLRIEPSDLIDNKDRCGMHPSWPDLQGVRQVLVSNGRSCGRG